MITQIEKPEASLAATFGEPRAAFRSRQETIEAFGPLQPVVPEPGADLAGAVAAVFEEMDPDSVIAGALPFDTGAAACLWYAPRVHRSGKMIAPPPAKADPPRSERWRLRPDPDAPLYARAVERALALMAADAIDPLRKVVLSRSLVAETDRPIDLAGLLSRLSHDPAVTAFLMPLPSPEGTPRALVGATPERLLTKRDGTILSHPLAGSARRAKDLGADAAAAAALSRSAKDRHEHAIVVEFILDTLAPHCRRLWRPEGAALVSTATMWHLGTRIMGELKDAETPAIALAALLHPTPAVCGLPRTRASRLIGELEPYDRGFYAGTVGWCDGRGDGSWHVTIRCAEIAGCTARLYAGAGIVEGSDPWGEVDETAAKFGAMMAALGIPPVAEKRPGARS
ncbi:isochorismate synthase [Acuticoccus mangrovi]|uniref:isochorismate synthase n=1 Tax=Acuticoccus mangrovi TaxID=2796142 RepID=A0A934ILD5_9HYPH|nr:isochorismate synthase [Acuticoccus mangrovi]MBJ3778759.1 isochorismate synthase [Acuticoccus mangrovi]